MKRVLWLATLLAGLAMGVVALADAKTDAKDKAASTMTKAGDAMKAPEAMKTEAEKAPAAMMTEPMMKKMSELMWKDAEGYPSGVKVAEVFTGPSGVGTAYMKIPAGTKVAAHTHPAVHWGCFLSGTGTFGFGTDPTKGMEYAPGSFLHVPMKAPHWLMAKTETVICANAVGAPGIDYVNTSEDPRKGSHSSH
jgi:quercetin dioxygenase-like cupin family protein